MGKDQKPANNQDVSTALGLLLDTLKEEKNRIFETGQKAMAEQNTVTARAVLDFADKLKVFTEKEVQGLIAKWNELLKMREAASPAVQKIVTGDGKLFGMKTRKSRAGFTRKVTQPKAPRSNFMVTFADGTEIRSNQAAETFALAIAKIGVERVAALGLINCGEPLVSKSMSAKYPGRCKMLPGDYYVSTLSSTNTKINLLKTMAKLLKINLKITPAQGTQKK